MSPKPRSGATEAMASVAALWPHYGLLVASLWPPCGLLVASLWPPCGLLVASLLPACNFRPGVILYQITQRVKPYPLQILLKFGLWCDFGSTNWYFKFELHLMNTFLAQTGHPFSMISVKWAQRQKQFSNFPLMCTGTLSSCCVEMVWRKYIDGFCHCCMSNVCSVWFDYSVMVYSWFKLHKNLNTFFIFHTRHFFLKENSDSDQESWVTSQAHSREVQHLHLFFMNILHLMTFIKQQIVPNQAVLTSASMELSICIYYGSHGMNNNQMKLKYTIAITSYWI